MKIFSCTFLNYYIILLHFNRLPASPSHTDVSSLYGLRSPMAPSESVTALASRIHWEQLRQNYLSPVSGRRYSPGSIPGRGLLNSVPQAMSFPWLHGKLGETKTLFRDFVPENKNIKILLAFNFTVILLSSDWVK